MKEIITKFQASEMGYGYGYLEGVEGVSLKEVLDFYINSNQFINEISIYNKDNLIYAKITRNFDDNSLFWFSYYLNNEECKVRGVKFRYCYQQKDLDVYLEE